MIVTLEEMKQHLRIETDDEDDLLEKLILQAQAVAEDFCRTTFGDTDEDGNEIAVPEPVRLAVLLFVSHYYENRDVAEKAVYNAMMTAFYNLLYPYRDISKMF